MSKDDPDVTPETIADAHADAADLERKKARENPMTSYVVFQEASPGLWQSFGSVEALNAEIAIRTVVKSAEGGDGTVWAAAPARSWNPVTVATETKTTTKLEPTL